MSEPIQMPNRQLAQAMLDAGCELEGVQNEYTGGFLRSRGLMSKNQVSERVFEESVISAAKIGVMGNVTFFFKRTGKAESMIAAWDKIADLIRLHRQWEEMAVEDREGCDPPPAIPEHSDEAIAAILCVHANNQKQLPKIVLSYPPTCNTLKGTGQPTGQTSTGVPAGTTTGAGKVWSVLTSDADRAEHLKLHPRIIKEWINPFA